MSNIGGFCNSCGGWAEALDRHRRCAACHVKRDDQMEELREAVAMYRERVPAEVAEALDKVKP